MARKKSTRKKRSASKKAQGISLNVIIIAAIALLVLVILSVIFIGRFGTFSSESANCESQGGNCVVGICPQGQIEYRSWSCPKTPAGASQRCCINAG